MPASWGDLFDRGAEHDVDLETVRAAADELSVREGATDGDAGTTGPADPTTTPESEGDDA